MIDFVDSTPLLMETTKQKVLTFNGIKPMMVTGHFGHIALSILVRVVRQRRTPGTTVAVVIQQSSVNQILMNQTDNATPPRQHP